MIDDNKQHILAIVAYALHSLSALQQDLFWHVDLENDFGLPDNDTDPDVYLDGRFHTMIQRLQSALESTEGNSQLRIKVTPHKGFRAEKEKSPVSVELQGNAKVTIANLAQLPPPAGRWTIQPREPRDRHAIPSSYFLDGIPF